MVTVQQINDERPQDGHQLIPSQELNGSFRVNRMRVNMTVSIPAMNSNDKLEKYIPIKARPLYDNMMETARNKEITDADSHLTKTTNALLRAVDRLTLGELDKLAYKITDYAVNIINEKIEEETSKISEFQEEVDSDSDQEILTNDTSRPSSISDNPTPHKRLTAIFVILGFYLLICTVVTTYLLIKKIYRWTKLILKKTITSLRNYARLCKRYISRHRS